MSNKPKKIGFAANVITEEPMRMQVLCEASKFIAVDKPADILFDSYIGSPVTKSVMVAMRQQPDKPEFVNLGIERPYALNQIDYEISGIALIAKNKEFATEIRNALWSGAAKFEYTILTRSIGEGKNSFEVDLPILMHSERPVWLVSHRYGKKAKTQFEHIKTAGGYQLWKASTNVARPHQIRVHSNECRLYIPGETLYSRTKYIFMSDIKKDFALRYGQDERALYPHLAIHLSKITISPRAFGEDVDDVEINSSLPKGFAVCLRKLGFDNL